jgi:hypothetical protein
MVLARESLSVINRNELARRALARLSTSQPVDWDGETKETRDTREGEKRMSNCFVKRENVS